MMTPNMYAAPGAAPGPGGTGRVDARLEGDTFVVAKESSLKPICLKCGTTDAIEYRSQNFQWTPTWARMSILFCTPGGLLAILLTTKRGRLGIPLCKPCNTRWKNAQIALVVGILLLVGSGMSIGAFSEPTIGIALFGVSFVAFLVIALVMMKPAVLHATKIDDTHIHLKNFHAGAAQSMLRA